MFTKDQILSYLKYSIVAAILYLVSVAIFLYMDNYTQTYILYIGNVVFALVIVVFILNFNKKRDKNASTKMMIAAGHITTVAGVLMSIVGVFILLAIMKPIGYATVSQTTNELAKPTPGLEGNGHALLFVLLMDAIFGNVGAGSFISFLLPNTAKQDQKGETATINPEVGP